MKKHGQNIIDTVMEEGAKTICLAADIVGADDIVQMAKRLITASSNPFSPSKE